MTLEFYIHYSYISIFLSFFIPQYVGSAQSVSDAEEPEYEPLANYFSKTPEQGLPKSAGF